MIGVGMSCTSHTDNGDSGNGVQKMTPDVHDKKTKITSYCVVFRWCEGVGGVQGALTLCGAVAQAFLDDRVVELKEQLRRSRRRKTGRKSKRRREKSNQRECTMDMTVDDKVFAQA